MRHRKSVAKLGRTSSHRKAMIRNMVTSLFKHDRIKTTDKKAKELRGWADHIITLAKRGDLHARRQALSFVREKKVVHQLFDEAEESFGDRNGGYTRIIKIGRRPGDAAPMSIIELVKETSISKPSVKKVAPETAEAVVPVVETEAVSGGITDKAAEAAGSDAEETESVAQTPVDEPAAASEAVADAAPEAAEEGAAEKAPDEAEAPPATDAAAGAEDASEKKE